MQALRTDRVNHAYLFSGPRGCGKTTSARILARCLNCAKGPTADALRRVPSCVELARGGPGQLDVVEIDAASHGGVDDARDLRERAMFAPARDRYKVFILDEAHMVSPQGFNALLKLVEEPPPHIKFIFATTEPDKVIGTIRSRTHHYPFRLVPPEMLASTCRAVRGRGRQGRAGRAAARRPRRRRLGARHALACSTSCIGGAGADGVAYERAVALLGYTPGSLLDEVVDAFAAGDGAAVFGVVDRVIETGQDPRRFVEDLLERLRDLVIVAAVPDAFVHGLPRRARRPGRAAAVAGQRLRSVGADPCRRHRQRSADGVSRCHGAPPAARADVRAHPRARVRQLDAGIPGPTRPAGAPSVDRRWSDRAAAAPAPVEPVVAKPTPVEPAETHRSEPRRTRTSWLAPRGRAHRDPTATRGSRPKHPPADTRWDRMTIADVRRLWPEVLDKIRELRRFAWVMLSQNAQVMAFDGDDPDDRPGQPGSSRLVHQQPLRRVRATGTACGARRDVDDRGGRRPERSPRRILGPGSRTCSRAGRHGRAGTFRLLGRGARSDERRSVARGQQPRCIRRSRRSSRRGRGHRP